MDGLPSMIEQIIQQFKSGDVTTPQVVALVIVLSVFLIVFVKASNWVRDGGLYYKMHPAAKLLDDAAKQGKLAPGSMESIVQRIGTSNDLKAEAAAIRAEMGIK